MHYKRAEHREHHRETLLQSGLPASWGVPAMKSLTPMLVTLLALLCGSSDIDTGAVDSLKVLDPDGRLEKRTWGPRPGLSTASRLRFVCGW